MTDSELKSRITEDMKTAMRSKDKQRLGVIRLILSEIKRIEVDERIELDDTRIIGILDKMTKQRRESISQFEKAGRTDLVDQETFEITVIDQYLPEPLGADEVAAIINSAIEETGAESMKDMGRVMGILQPKLKGLANMSEVSGLVKARLA